MEHSDGLPDPDHGVAERLAARERVILDREIELYRIRNLAMPGRLRRAGRVRPGASDDQPEAEAAPGTPPLA